MPRQDLTRRLDDQAMILAAIKVVKAEFNREYAENPDNWMQHGQTLLRLSNLYSLLDIDRLAKLCAKHSVRDEKKAA